MEGSSQESLEERLESLGLADLLQDQDDVVRARAELMRLRESRAWDLLSELTSRSQQMTKDRMMEVSASADGAYQFFELKGYAAAQGFMAGMLEGMIDELDRLYATYVDTDGDGEE